MSDEKAITLYLSEWQKRMVRDYVKGALRINKIIISKIPKKEWVMYRQPIIKSGGWNLYLTDEQINHVSEEMGLKTKISALNVSSEMLKSGTIAFK